MQERCNDIESVLFVCLFLFTAHSLMNLKMDNEIWNGMGEKSVAAIAPRDKKNKKQKRMAESTENVGVCDKWIY